jgi:hypothetical protein
VTVVRKDLDRKFLASLSTTRSIAYLGDIPPFELITRCQGTLPS